MSKDSLPQSRLKELLNYDEKTGVFTWVKNAGSKRSGSIAGWNKIRALGEANG